MQKKDICKRTEDFSKWYNQLVVKSGLAEKSDVRGCMVIKPYGFSIWEKIKENLDKKFKDTGHSNAYFPLFIPKSYFNKEADHVKGFAKECAVVTHYKLKSDKNNKIVVDENAKLEEELIVRPTSETIIWNTYKDWIQSYRDLPILVNQWANVVRWEMRTRLFLRTSEFLWQEGHTAHATKKEAIEEAELILELYANFFENFLAIPIIKGIKTDSEKFAGAVTTYCVEAMMQDGKALQAGTSHFLGQNFAKAFDVKFSSKSGKQEHVWATSWGVSTRMIGGLIMMHSDDNGLVLPPKVAPIQVVIIPIIKKDGVSPKVQSFVKNLCNNFDYINISYKYDDDNKYKPGWKYSEYELKGVPIRITIGERDIENQQIEVFRRDTLEKTFIPIDKIEERIKKLLDEIQQNCFSKAKSFLSKKTTEVNNYTQFKKVLEEEGGFIKAYWDGSDKTEQKIKEETKATIRCIPMYEKQNDLGYCIYSGKKTTIKALFAKSY